MRLLLLTLIASVALAQSNRTHLPDTCSGGGAFGLYRRESGCAISNCDCFPVLFQCDSKLADGLGQCALSRVGWTLIVLAFAINLIVPGVFLFTRYFIEKEKATNKNDYHIENKMDQRNDSHGQFYIDLRQFRNAVPDTALGLRANPKIFMETMSKGWLRLICYCLLFSFIGCLALLIPPTTFQYTAYPLTRQNTTAINATAYKISSMTETILPGATRYLSIQGDFCAVANDILPLEGEYFININYNVSLDIDKTSMFDKISGHTSLGCICSNGQCHLKSIEEGALGAMPLVYFPWYEDAWHPFKASTLAHNFSVNASFVFSSKAFIPFIPVHPIPHLLFLSHHSFIERVIDIVNLFVFLLDVIVPCVWCFKLRHVKWLPERQVVLGLCIVNLLSSCPVLYVTDYFDATANFQTLYYFSEGFTALCCGLWLLGFLFLVDMQRTRHFGLSFFAIKIALGIVVLSTYIYVYIYSESHYLSQLNFWLAILCSTIFRGVMVDVRNNLRSQPYVVTRPEQLTARLLYAIGIMVTYIFFFVALFADPVPTVSSYVPKTLILTDMSVLLIVRSATWVLAVLFLPPTSYTAQVYYTRARTKLPRLTRDNRDFALAHLKQVVGGNSFYNRSLSMDDGYTDWRAPDAFVVETACALYNQSIAIYEEPIADTTEATGYRLPSHDHFEQDGVNLAEAFYDAPTDTYGWVLKGDKRIIVVFRGTLSLPNAFTDLQVNMVYPDFAVDDKKLYGARVHSGFWAAYLTVRASIRRIVEATMAEMDEFQLYITGHSLGGALATLMAMDVMTDSTWQLKEEVVVYTYGSPRVGNHKFASSFKQYVHNCYRVCADGDAIVGTPKSSIQSLCVRNLSYKHVGNNVLLSTRAKGTFLINPNIVERAFISRLRVNALAHFGPTYMNLLEKGTNFTKKPKYQSSHSFKEDSPLLYETI
ncbi:alpha/beta-hydrolase [Thraustotheca clavata]|uniref:Alpha/beta-hydrolase n=1 Tax=Thraustotheca clavata TaxID=74557 RepID=A0A1V9YYK0_9STRA|nr:alpha/beta-hydrolase [Thraustotheca clavata]